MMQIKGCDGNKQSSTPKGTSIRPTAQFEEELCEKQFQKLGKNNQKTTFLEL